MAERRHYLRFGMNAIINEHSELTLLNAHGHTMGRDAAADFTGWLVENLGPTVVSEEDADTTVDAAAEVIDASAGPVEVPRKAPREPRTRRKPAAGTEPS